MLLALSAQSQAFENAGAGLSTVCNLIWDIELTYLVGLRMNWNANFPRESDVLVGSCFADIRYKSTNQPVLVAECFSSFPLLHMVTMPQGPFEVPTLGIPALTQMCHIHISIVQLWLGHLSGLKFATAAVGVDGFSRYTGREYSVIKSELD